MTVEITGLNLERFLREAQKDAIALKKIRRTGERRVVIRASYADRARLRGVCLRFGWEMREVRAGAALVVLRFFRRRPMLAAGALLCAALLALSSAMVLRVEVCGAAQYEPLVRDFLAQEGAAPWRMKRSLSLDGIESRLLVHLPGLSFAALRHEGSVLVAECRLCQDGEQVKKRGSARDLIAAEAGVVTRVIAQSGTPLVCPGDAVYPGQVIVLGEERAQKGTSVPVIAQAQVLARVWAQGRAKAALHSERTQETGRVRRRVTIRTPFFSRVVVDAQPFLSQETEEHVLQANHLFVPLVRETEIFREILRIRTPKKRADAASDAQAAAENLAKKQLPAGALILDKWVDYSMIDNEFVYASVVLEYERDIAVRAGDENGRMTD